MTRSLRFAALALLVVAAVVAAGVPAMLPSPVVTTPAPHWTPDGLTVRGAYHVHSVTSDGTGTVDAIAEAASRAGLQFVVFTDHGDGTRTPEPPRYRSGVLCIDAFEVNTTGGHLVVLGAAPSPYPLAGTPHAVLEDVHRLGGIGIAAHPGSPRPSLRWTGWDAPIDGIEWLNADSEWRDELLGSLGRLLLTYAFRPAESLASTLDRPDEVLRQWDGLAAGARIVALAGADAHARLGSRGRTDPYEEGWHVRVPSYEAAFRTFGLRVRLDTTLSGDPQRDAQDVLDRIRWGRVFTVVDGLATPGAFEFTATSGGQSAQMGDALGLDGDVRLHARMAAPAGTRLVVMKGGAPLYDTTESEVHLGVGASPGVYRIELYSPDAPGRPPVPWLVSNPVYVGMRAAQEATARARRRPAGTGRDPIALDEASPEMSDGSDSRVLTAERATSWAYDLADIAGAYAALRLPASGLAGADRLQVRARADAPMRLWVQLRSTSSGAEERWGQTMYLDPVERSHDLFFDRFEPMGETSTAAPRLDAVESVLMVVDGVNARPGSSGRVHIVEVRPAVP